MVKRHASPGGTSSYTVGYGKPPIHTRFQPGQSGNPGGRRRGVCNLNTDVKRTLASPVRVKEGGRTRKKSTQAAALMVLREKALQGDGRALDCLLELAMRFNNDGAEAAPAQALGADDHAILAAYVANTASAATSVPANLSDEAVSSPTLRSKRGKAK